MGQGIKPVWVCDVCGFDWVRHPGQTAEGFKACLNSKCRSRFWNGAGRKCKRCSKPLGGLQRDYCSRICKDRTRNTRLAEGRWLEESGQHHALCACMVCLTDIGAYQDSRRGHRKTYGVRRGVGSALATKGFPLGSDSSSLTANVVHIGGG